MPVPEPTTGVGPQPNAGGAQQAAPTPQQQAPQPQPTPQASPQAAQVPPQTPPQSNQAAGDDSDVSEFESRMRAALEGTETQAPMDEHGKLINAVSKDTLWQNVKANFFQDLKAYAAQNRVNVGRNSTEKMTGAEAVYGPGNVRMRGDDVWVKPEGSKSFVRLNQNVVNPLMDAVLSRLISAPGFAANTAGVAAGAAGSEIAPGASLVAGGAAGAAAQTFVDRAMNQYLGQADPNVDTNALAKKNAVIGGITAGALGAAGGAVKGVLGTAGESAASAIEQFKNAAPTPTETLDKFSPGVDKLAQVKNGLGYVFDQVHGPTGAVHPEGAEGAVSDALDSVNKIHQDLKNNMQMVQDEVQKFADANPDKKVGVQKTLSTMRDYLSDEGYVFDGKGRLIEGKQRFNDSQGRLVTGESNPRGTANTSFNNKAAAAYKDMWSNPQGVEFDRANSYRSDLDSMIDYKTADPDTRRAQFPIQKIRASLNEDLGAYTDQAVGNSQDAAGKLWRQTKQDYGSKIDMIRKVQDTLDTPEDRAAFVDKFYNSGSNVDKQQTMGYLKSLLGEQSDQWRGIKGELFNRIVNTGNQNGAVNVPVVSGFFDNPNNKYLKDMLFPETKDYNLFKAFMSQSADISTAPVLKQGQKSLISNVFGWVRRAGMDPEKAIQVMHDMTGNNKQSASYLSEEILNAAKNVHGEEQKEAIRELYNANAQSLKSMRTVIIHPSQGKSYEKLVNSAPPTTKIEMLNPLATAGTGSALPQAAMQTQPQDREPAANAQ